MIYIAPHIKYWRAFIVVANGTLSGIIRIIFLKSHLVKCGIYKSKPSLTISKAKPKIDTISSPLIGAVMNHDNPNDLNFDSDEKLDNAIKDALNQLETRFTGWKMVHMAIDNIEESNMEMVTKTMELHRNIQAMGKQANLRQQLNETLREQLKYLKEEHARMTAYKNKSHGELVSDFAAEFAKHRILT